MIFRFVPYVVLSTQLLLPQDIAACLSFHMDLAYLLYRSTIPIIYFLFLKSFFQLRIFNIHEYTKSNKYTKSKFLAGVLHGSFFKSPRNSYLAFLTPDDFTCQGERVRHAQWVNTVACN